MKVEELECCYLYPTEAKPGGDLEKPCKEQGEWAIWEEGTHPSEVDYACTEHVGQLLGTTKGEPMYFQVWPATYDCDP